MSVFKKDRVTRSFPAYDIVEREPDDAGFINLTANELLGFEYKTRNYGYQFRQHRIGSVVSYALEYNEDPVEAYNRAKAKGHQTHWINACAVSITNGWRERYSLVEVKEGTRVRFEGLLATVERDGHENLKLVPIAE